MMLTAVQKNHMRQMWLNGYGIETIMAKMGITPKMDWSRNHQLKGQKGLSLEVVETIKTILRVGDRFEVLEAIPGQDGKYEKVKHTVTITGLYPHIFDTDRHSYQYIDVFGMKRL